MSDTSKNKPKIFGLTDKRAKEIEDFVRPLFDPITSESIGEDIKKITKKFEIMNEAIFALYAYTEIGCSDMIDFANYLYEYFDIILRD